MSNSLKAMFGPNFTDAANWKEYYATISTTYTLRTPPQAACEYEYRLICEQDPEEPYHLYTLLRGKVISEPLPESNDGTVLKEVRTYEVIYTTHCTKRISNRQQLVDFIIEAETDWETVEANLLAEIKTENEKAKQEFEMKNGKAKLDFLLGL